MKKYYENQGVVFTGPFAIIMDTIYVISQITENPYDLPMIPAIKKALNVEHLPPLTGACIFGEVTIYFTDPD